MTRPIYISMCVIASVISAYSAYTDGSIVYTIWAILFAGLAAYSMFFEEEGE